MKVSLQKTISQRIAALDQTEATIVKLLLVGSWIIFSFVFDLGLLLLLPFFTLVILTTTRPLSPTHLAWVYTFVLAGVLYGLFILLPSYGLMLGYFISLLLGLILFIRKQNLLTQLLLWSIMLSPHILMNL